MGRNVNNQETVEYRGHQLVKRSSGSRLGNYSVDFFSTSTYRLFAYKGRECIGFIGLPDEMPALGAYVQDPEVQKALDKFLAREPQDHIAGEKDEPLPSVAQEKPFIRNSFRTFRTAEEFGESVMRNWEWARHDR